MAWWPRSAQRSASVACGAKRLGWIRVLGGIRSVVSLFGYACLKWFLGDRTIGSRHFNRAGFETPCATVDTNDHARASGVGSHKREGGWDGAGAEEPLPSPEDHRKGQQSVFINEIILVQRLGQAATPVNLNLP